MLPLLNNSETQQVGTFAYFGEDNTLIFEDANGQPFEICAENLEKIYNLSSFILPPEYYREKKVFSKR